MSGAVDGAREAGTDELAGGIAAFTARDLPAAHSAFERAHRAEPRAPRAMSWYGVTLVLVERNSNLGVLLCDQALRLVGPEPELLLNAARVHLALNQRERAVRHLARGLELFPAEPRLAAAWEALGRRSRPVIPFLPRGNPANVWLGRLRHRWRNRIGASPYLDPVSLGEPPPSHGT
jgi:tetratricopeptide (TPR) repeat protein